ncbi:SAM-dependent methyltransferase [Ornithinibacillus salinisoli]|uniref:SAM-dependent methyltransferase n=1 Tax=Ornithinibacillus salinisoli TaxID=1848459 RepID=A0ABW4VVX6_9BACI
MKEYYFDKLLNIRTAGKGSMEEPGHYHPYEPTPYSALETLFQQYEVKPNDHIVDFGCGKGRLIFFIHYFYHATVTGVDRSESFIRQAMENRERYGSRFKNSLEKVQFQCCLAENYRVDSQENRFYFFNPFSVQIFISVINNIMKSVEGHPRDVEVILYYPSEDYIYYLVTNTPFNLKCEIQLTNLYEKDTSERFLIYQLT